MARRKKRTSSAATFLVMVTKMKTPPLRKSRLHQRLHLLRNKYSSLHYRRMKEQLKPPTRRVVLRERPATHHLRMEDKRLTVKKRDRRAPDHSKARHQEMVRVLQDTRCLSPDGPRGPSMGFNGPPGPWFDGPHVGNLVHGLMVVLVHGLMVHSLALADVAA